MVKIAKLFGPPGTGKTRYMKRQVVKDMKEKYYPSAVGAVSLTNAAVDELKSRVKDEIDNEPEYVRNIATIHSHCFGLLGIKRDQVADTPKRIKEFSETYPEFAFNPDRSKAEDGELYSTESMRLSRNNMLYSFMNLYRNKQIHEREWNNEVIEFRNKWESFCFENDFIDYTGMIERCLDARLTPNIRALYVDEFQDTSNLASSLIKMWAESCDKLVVIGDVDQCIYEFAGADPSVMLSMRADFDNTSQDSKILKKSYRVAPNIHRYAVKIIEKSFGRQSIEYYPSDRYGDGDVFECQMPELPDIYDDETTLILTRCNYHTTKWTQLLYEKGIPFSNPWRPSEKRWNPCDTKSWKAAKTYYEITDFSNVNPDFDPEITWSDLKIMTEKCKAKTACPGWKTRVLELPTKKDRKIRKSELQNYGFTYEFINRLGPLDDFFKFTGKAQDLIRKVDLFPYKEIFSEPPKVFVGTIHSVKGGEADNVYIDAQLSPKIKKALNGNNRISTYNTEYRIAYVAATRARKKLGIMNNDGSIYERI